MTRGRILLLALIVTLCTGAGLWWLVYQGTSPQDASWDQAIKEAKQGKYELVHTDEIRQLLEEAPQKTTVIDLRGKRDYGRGHIPGAINVPMGSSAWSNTPDKGQLAALLGPDKSRYVIFTDANLAGTRGDSAARAATELGYTHVYRHAKGFEDWQAEGLRVAKTSGRHRDESGLQIDEPIVFGWAMIGTLLSIFLGGMALNLTPCVYPLVPITVAYFGTRQGQGRFVLAAHALLYVVGLAFTNSLLGVAASLTGGLMGSALQHPAVLIFVGLVLLVLASSLFGFWEIRLPSSVITWASRSYAGYAGSLFMGMTLGVVAAPCIGPFVLGLLTWVATMGDPLMGFLVFFSLSLGLGVPIFVLALLSGSLNKLPASGAWMLWVRKLMGWVLVGMAAYFVGPLLPNSYETAVLAAILAAASLHLGWIDGTESTWKGFQSLRWAVGVAGLVCAGFLVGALSWTPSTLSWQPYSNQVLAQAKVDNKPVIMDFYASWCAPCRRMEQSTFTDPKVIREAENGFAMVKVDLTRAADTETKQLLKQFEITGVPTVVFLDARGRERKDLRLVGTAPPADFLGRMAQLK